VQFFAHVRVARSIHTTRRELEEHVEDDYLDLDHKRAEATRLRAALARKRRIKAQVAEERRSNPQAGTGAGPVVDPVVDPATLPILVEAPREHVHHGASPEELIAVLRRLPPGVVDGIRAIRLGLGAELQGDGDEDGGGEPDPLTGRRPSLPLLPGVHSGRVLGEYRADRAEIYLCGYVYDAASLAERRIKELYLKLRALATLVHEVAHHHDHTARVARGRWLADDTEQLEIYAERMEHAWVQAVVIPYLDDAHAAEVAFLREWMLRHGGADVPLSVIADDPRLTCRGGGVICRFGFRSALENLLEDVEAGRDPLRTRVCFARELHYNDEYALPRAILAGVLAERPDHAEAHTLLADIDVHEGHLAAAEGRCREVLARDPRCFDAWDALTDALRHQQRWADVVEAATRGLACANADAHGGGMLLIHRARAHLELGDHAALSRDLGGLALGVAFFRAWAGALRAMQLLRRGEVEAALALATRLLADRAFALRVELVAVCVEAAHRLGRPEAARPLTERELERLRNLGHGAWVDRIVSLAAGIQARR
jgi:tetratricopeptide (TPR) repeat protein